jgi:antitoxin VapB
LDPKEEAVATAKVFWSGNSQAIRLPKDFRFPPDTEEVEIRREGERIVLEPVQVEEWPESFWRAFEGMPEDFERPPQVRQTRESLDL